MYYESLLILLLQWNHRDFYWLLPIPCVSVPRLFVGRHLDITLYVDSVFLARLSVCVRCRGPGVLRPRSTIAPYYIHGQQHVAVPSRFVGLHCVLPYTLYTCAACPPQQINVSSVTTKNVDSKINYYFFSKLR